jgi:hypothetical protein
MTASIPTHRLFVHVRRLVAKGYKVSFGFDLWERNWDSLLESEIMSYEVVLALDLGIMGN